MKTDALFYELFKFEPQSLFELAGLALNNDYVFESITLKHTEKRLDGFFKSKQPNQPNVFLEIQGYYDPKIYWRLFREICSWYEQTNDHNPFFAVILFIDRQHDPNDFLLTTPQLVRLYLVECLEKLGNKPSALTVLKPLVAKDKKTLIENVPQWQTELKELNLPTYQFEFLFGLLEYSILQRFPTLTLEEIRQMIHLTPLDKTVAGKQLMRIGHQKSKTIGQIVLLQRLLKQPITPEEDLLEMEISELKILLKSLDSLLNDEGLNNG